LNKFNQGDAVFADVVQKWQNVPEQLHLLADSLPDKGCRMNPDHSTEASATDPVPGRIIKAL